MVATVDILFGAAIVVGLFVCGLGLYTYRQWNQVGVRSLTATVILLGLCGAVGGVVGLVMGAAPPDDVGQPPWSGAGFLVWAFASVPWLLFVLQYTGWYTQFRRRTVGLLYIPIVFASLGGVLYEGTNVIAPGLIDVLVSLAFIYAMALVFVGAFLLVQATQSYVHLAVSQGIGLSVMPIVLVVALNSAQMIQSVSVIASVVGFVLALGVGAIGLTVALVRRPLLESTPAVETIGERAIARETDDLVLVADEDDTVVKCNEATVDALPRERDGILRTPLTAVLGHESDELAEMETISLDAETRRRYDPQLSTIADGNETELGTVLSLRDVTERELREQRLAVLNRVLRHNLRNDVEVIKSHAEVLGEDDEHVQTIVDRADMIATLGQNARTIDQFVSDSTSATRCDIMEAIDDVLSTVECDGVAVSVHGPESATVETNSEALRGALESALSNAVKYADSSVAIAVEAQPQRYEVTVTDDGPGIPGDEIDSLDAGTETALQHGTGLGLWQLKWAVTTMGGDLEFDTSEGTTVTVQIPDQSNDEVARTR